MNEWRPDKVGGLYSTGMHDFVMRELELGFRATAAEDMEWREPMAAITDWTYRMYVNKENHGTDRSASSG